MSGSYGPKIGQNSMKYDILSTMDHFHLKKYRNEFFSGSTIFWRLLGEYEPLSVPYCYCKGLSSESRAYGPKIGQNFLKYDFWALFDHFHFKKDSDKFIFW